MKNLIKLFVCLSPWNSLINTHDHDDHWLGNSFYKSKGATLIASKNCAENIVVGMKTRMERILETKCFGQTKIVKIDTIVDNNLTLTVDDEKLEIMQPISVAHTQGDLIVYLPSKKVLFVGDLLFNGRLTSLRDGSLLGSLEALVPFTLSKPKFNDKKKVQVQGRFLQD